MNTFLETSIKRIISKRKISRLYLVILENNNNFLLKTMILIYQQ